MPLRFHEFDVPISYEAGSTITSTWILVSISLGHHWLGDAGRGRIGIPDLHGTSDVVSARAARGWLGRLETVERILPGDEIQLGVGSLCSIISAKYHLTGILVHC